MRFSASSRVVAGVFLCTILRHLFQHFLYFRLLYLLLKTVYLSFTNVLPQPCRSVHAMVLWAFTSTLCGNTVLFIVFSYCTLIVKTRKKFQSPFQNLLAKYSAISISTFLVWYFDTDVPPWIIFVGCFPNVPGEHVSICVSWLQIKEKQVFVPFNLPKAFF